MSNYPVEGAGPPAKERLARYLRYRDLQGRLDHPKADFSRIYLRRGTPFSLENFGASSRAASDEQKLNRSNAMMTGRGKYSLGRSLRALGGYAKSVGKVARTGVDIVERVGRARAGLSRGLYTGSAGGSGLYTGAGLYTGSGVYTGPEHHTNNLIAGSKSRVPHFMGAGDETGAVTIMHREYISDIYAPGVTAGPAISFQNTAYALNPALASTFPFLSQIAQNYDEYEFLQLIFHYRSTTTDIGSSTTGQCGTVILCTNYNAATAPFTDKQSMLEYAHAHDCKLTEHMTHGVECDPAKSAMSPSLFCRANPVVINQDLKTYDKGLFQIAIANAPSAYNGFPVGELWVEYSVVLRKPKLFVTRGLEIDRDAFFSSTNVESTMVYSTNAAAVPTLILGPLGSVSSGLKGQQNNIGALVAVSSAIQSNYVVTLPATYTGPLRIVLDISVRVAAQWANSNAFPNFVFNTTGNVSNINDLYDAYGLPTFYENACSQFVTTNTWSWKLEIHVFVQMATQGVNNTITLGPNLITNPAIISYTTPVQSVSLDITQYQTLQNAQQNSNTPAFRPLYINNVGAITIPS